MSFLTLKVTDVTVNPGRCGMQNSVDSDAHALVTGLDFSEKIFSFTSWLHDSHVTDAGPVFDVTNMFAGFVPWAISQPSNVLLIKGVDLFAVGKGFEVNW